MRLFPADPPPGPARPGFWRSPLRGPWLTAVLGLGLLVLLALVTITGFLSHAAYQGALGHNAIVPFDRDLPLLRDLGWPTSPSWLYAATQGIHVTVGIVAVPLVLAKLWSVIPRLWSWPPLRDAAHLLERVTLLLLVGGILFQLATGIVNAQLYYPFKFNFVVAHYYGAWVFTAALVLHVAIKAGSIRRALRARGALGPVRDAVASRTPEPYEPDGLVAPTPAAVTISRRGVFGLLGGAMGALFVVQAGQAIGGPLRPLAVLATRGGSNFAGPQGFPVNHTAAAARITPQLVGPAWRLELVGARTVRLTRAELLAMEQHSEELPIACVEGWSALQTWTGVRLRDLAARCGAAGASEVMVESVQPAGVLRRASLDSGQIDDTRSLLALRVGGEDLAPDHGYPARVIVPALPGVHCTKWVGRMTFTGGGRA